MKRRADSGNVQIPVHSWESTSNLRSGALLCSRSKLSGTMSLTRPPEQTNWRLLSKNNRYRFTFPRRVLNLREKLIKLSRVGLSKFDQPLRAALSKMIHKQDFTPTKGSALGLRYLKDRVSVPRDMPLLAARELRKALEETAQIDGPIQGPPIPIKNRFDQNPLNFLR